MTDDEQLAGDLLTVPEKPPFRWAWIYRDVRDDRVDEIHYFPIAVIPKDKFATPVFDLDTTLVPSCKTVFTGPWRVFNTGGGDPLRLARITGNNVAVCTKCQEVADAT